MKKEDLYSLIEYIKTVFIMFFVFFYVGKKRRKVTHYVVNGNLVCKVSIFSISLALLKLINKT